MARTNVYVSVSAGDRSVSVGGRKAQDDATVYINTDNAEQSDCGMTVQAVVYGRGRTSAERKRSLTQIVMLNTKTTQIDAVYSLKYYGATWTSVLESKESFNSPSVSKSHLEDAREKAKAFSLYKPEVHTVVIVPVASDGRWSCFDVGLPRPGMNVKVNLSPSGELPTEPYIDLHKMSMPLTGIGAAASQFRLEFLPRVNLSWASADLAEMTACWLFVQTMQARLQDVQHAEQNSPSTVRRQVTEVQDLLKSLEDIGYAANAQEKKSLERVAEVLLQAMHGKGLIGDILGLTSESVPVLSTEEKDRRAFIDNLKVGDQVFWADPDDGECSGVYKVESIQGDEAAHRDESTVVTLCNDSGSEIEAHIRELT